MTIKVEIVIVHVNVISGDRVEPGQLPGHADRGPVWRVHKSWASQYDQRRSHKVINFVIRLKWLKIPMARFIIRHMVTRYQSPLWLITNNWQIIEYRHKKVSSNIKNFWSTRENQFCLHFIILKRYLSTAIIYVSFSLQSEGFPQIAGAEKTWTGRQQNQFGTGRSQGVPQVVAPQPQQ